LIELLITEAAKERNAAKDGVAKAVNAG